MPAYASNMIVGEEDRKACRALKRISALHKDTEEKTFASPVSQRELSPAARRALAEAEARRAAQRAQPLAPKEVNGRNGLEPTRYGDWESKGIASDF